MTAFYLLHGGHDNEDDDDEWESSGGTMVSNKVGVTILFFAFTVIFLVGWVALGGGNPFDNPLIDEMGNAAGDAATQGGEQLVAFDWSLVGYTILGIIIGIYILAGIKIVRPTHRAAIETLGRYTRFMGQGITWILPGIQKLYRVNITEQLVDVMKQDTITKDNLNATVDAQVYYKVKDDEENLKKALYNVNNYAVQIVQLARTTLRNVIGTKEFKIVNSNRSELNGDIFDSIQKEVLFWGIEIIRVELKEIQPPADVQETMNRVIKAENTKDAEKDFAIANQTKADGERMAQIKIAEGDKEAQILRAAGEATAIIKVAEARAKEIEVVNESARAHFLDSAITLERLQVTRDSLDKNTKYILSKDGISPTLVVNESGDDVIPIDKGNGHEKKSKKERKTYSPTKSTDIRSQPEKRTLSTAEAMKKRGMRGLGGVSSTYSY